jgi:hypothetical protein
VQNEDVKLLGSKILRPFSSMRNPSAGSKTVTSHIHISNYKLKPPNITHGFKTDARFNCLESPGETSPEDPAFGFHLVGRPIFFRRRSN